MYGLFALLVLLQLFPTNPWPTAPAATISPRAPFVNAWGRNDEAIPGGTLVLFLPEDGKAVLAWRDGTEAPGALPRGKALIYFLDTPVDDTLTGRVYSSTDRGIIAISTVTLTLIGDEMASFSYGARVVTVCGVHFQERAPADVQAEHPCG